LFGRKALNQSERELIGKQFLRAPQLHFVPCFLSSSISYHPSSSARDDQDVNASFQAATRSERFSFVAPEAEQISNISIAQCFDKAASITIIRSSLSLWLRHSDNPRIPVHQETDRQVHPSLCLQPFFATWSSLS